MICQGFLFFNSPVKILLSLQLSLHFAQFLYNSLINYILNTKKMSHQMILKLNFNNYTKYSILQQLAPNENAKSKIGFFIVATSTIIFKLIIGGYYSILSTIITRWGIIIVAPLPMSPIPII